MGERDRIMSIMCVDESVSKFGREIVDPSHESLRLPPQKLLQKEKRISKGSDSDKLSEVDEL